MGWAEGYLATAGGCVVIGLGSAASEASYGNYKTAGALGILSVIPAVGPVRDMMREGGALAAEIKVASAPTMGEVAFGHGADDLIHVTTATAKQLESGLFAGSSFVRLGDVAKMVLADFKQFVVGTGAQGAGNNVIGIAVIKNNPQTFSRMFNLSDEVNAAGVPEFLTRTKLMPSNYVELPR